MTGGFRPVPTRNASLRRERPTNRADERPVSQPWPPSITIKDNNKLKEEEEEEEEEEKERERENFVCV